MSEIEKVVKDYEVEYGIKAHAIQNEDGTITVEPCCEHCHE